MKCYLYPRLALLVLLSGLGLAFAQPSTQLKPFSHAFVIVLENRGYDQVIGNPNLPTLNKLARTYGLAANYHAIVHPSLPNYVALISGGTWGSHSDDPSQTFSQPTLAGQLEQHGLTWKGYLQGLPKAGFTGPYAGGYAKKHDPFMLFPAIAQNPTRAAKVVPLSQLGRDLDDQQAPNFALIIPDLCHDLHGAPSCPVGKALDTAADTFVKRWVNTIMAKAWQGNAAIIITFDEGEEGVVTRVKSALGIEHGGGRIATIVIAREGPHPLVSNAPYNHYSLLRTLEQAWGLPYLGKAAQAKPMTEFFQPTP